MVSKKTLADLGWEVDCDRKWCVWLKSGNNKICIDRDKKDITLVVDRNRISYAELAAILDFIIEDAIY